MQNLLQRVRAALAERYDIASEIGRGAMAVVYRALDQRHDRTVAVKVLAPQLASAIGQERFLHEIRLAAGLTHPYVLPVLDSGEADGLLYYVMPFIEGRTLREHMAAEGELPINEAVRIACDVAEALEQAHAAGILHRDVKPSNILLTERHALLADFGVARAIDETGEERLTGTGVAVGSPAYMSPRQSDPAASPDARDDQYALACVLYEMLAGTPPFTASSRGALLRRHATDPVPSVRTVRPSVPKRLEAVLERALAKSAADRFPNIAAFGEAVADAVNGAASDARPGTDTGERLYALLRSPGRSGLIAAALGIIALAVGWIATTGNPSANSSFAIAPCEASIERDAGLGAEVAQATIFELLHVGPPLPVDFGRMRAWAAENAPVQGTQHRAAARRALAELGASYFVACALEDDGDEVQIKLTVFDDEGTITELNRVAMARDEGTLRIAQNIAVELLTHDGRTLLGQGGQLTEVPDATEAFLEAEQALLDYDLVAADSLYALALEYDPTFGFAMWRRSHVHRWQTVPGSPDMDLDSLFAASSDRLPAPDSQLLGAVITRPRFGPEALRRFRRVVDAHPDFPYGYLLYADEVYHRGTLGELGLPPDTARDLLARALQLNSRLGPAREHLIPTLLMLGEKEGARKSVDRLCADFPNARWNASIGPCGVWRLGWLERFDPDSAETARRFLTDPGRPVENLMFAARFARYANLFQAQRHLGNALVRRSARPEVAWHSGVNTVGLALSALGQPAASVQQFDRARDVDMASALFADMWAVVPHALGLEGFPARDAAEAASRLAATVADAAADSLNRARAAWALALHADGRASGADSADEFERWRDAVDRLVPARDSAYRLRVHLDGIARSRSGDPAGALETTDGLLVYDSLGKTQRPFGRAVLYWQRGEWHEAAGDPDSALKAWLWHWNTDLEGLPKREVQAAEIDGAFGAWARVRSARLARSLGPRYRETACQEARGVLDRWAPAPELFDPLPVEEPVARLVEEMHAIEAATCRDAK